MLLQVVSVINLEAANVATVVERKCLICHFVSSFLEAIKKQLKCRER